MTAPKNTSRRGMAAVTASLGAALISGGLIATAPPANAGCQYGGPGIISKCDAPLQPDGTWQRCVAFAQWVPSGMQFLPGCPTSAASPWVLAQHPADLAFADPPTHLDD